jgi:hypothetical protein
MRVFKTGVSKAGSSWVKYAKEHKPLQKSVRYLNKYARAHEQGMKKFVRKLRRTAFLAWS